MAMRPNSRQPGIPAAPIPHTTSPPGSVSPQMASMRANSSAVVRQYSPVAPFTTTPGAADPAPPSSAGQRLPADGEHAGQLLRGSQAILAGGAVHHHPRDAFAAQKLEDGAEAAGIQLAIREARNQNSGVDPLYDRHGPSYSGRQASFPLHCPSRPKHNLTTLFSRRGMLKRVILFTVVLAVSCNRDRDKAIKAEAESLRNCAQMINSGIRPIAATRDQRFQGKVENATAVCRGGDLATQFRATPWVDWASYWGTGDAQSKAPEFVTQVNQQAGHLSPTGRGVDGALLDLEYQRIELIKFNRSEEHTSEL